MEQHQLHEYVESLPIGRPPNINNSSEQDEYNPSSINLDKMPDTVVTGSNLIQFAGENNSTIRSAAALSLLAAQRVAANDPVIVEPSQWIARHNTVLQNLNWNIVSGGEIDSQFDSIDVAVHQAILPFLSAAFAPTASAGSLIIKAIEQLNDMDKNAPWITLFEKESQRFNTSEYQFSVVESTKSETTISLAAARFDASYGRTQVLFFKLTKQEAKFKASNSVMAISNDYLENINDPLKQKLRAYTHSYISQLDF